MVKGNDFDVVIIGGSYSGLSAAMALGRFLRRVLIIDSGQPCNRQTPHSHNFITQDGEKPGVIAEKARSQVMSYPTVQLLDDLAVHGERSDGGFAITTQSGQVFKAKKLIVATGIKDVMPNIAGFEACWGISVIHCPYCHGYEFKDRPTGIMGNGDRAFHLASLVNNLTDSLTILTSGKMAFDAEQQLKLKKNNIPIVADEIVQIEHEGGHIKNVVFANGDQVAFDAVYAVVPFVQQSHIPVDLGCQLTEQGYISIDVFQKTTVEGLYACGDNSSMMRSVANAVYAGNLTGAMVNKELTDEQF